MATLMDLIAGYSQGGAPVDDSSQSLGQAARDLYQGLINPKAWQEVKQATQRTTNIAPAVLESLARGSIAQVPGTIGDTSLLLRQLAPQTMQQIFGNRVAPTTEEILGYVPRATSAYQGSQEHEMVGGLLSPAMGYFAKALPLATKDMPIGLALEYQGSHLFPNAKVYGGTIDDLGKIMPEEVYTSKGKRLYGINNPNIDNEWWKEVYLSKGKPDRMVEVHRAVPKGIKEINNGDWVTTSKTYAKMHGENALNGEYDILSKKVPAKTLSSEGYPYEFGYNEEITQPTITVKDRTIPVTLHPVEERQGHKIEFVNTDKFEKAFKKDETGYIGPSGTENAIKNRYKGVEEFLKTAPSMRASEVYVKPNGNIIFGDGRHRFAYLRDQGLEKIPISMDEESIKNAKKYGYID